MSMSDTPKLTVKEFDPFDRPREKAARFGLGALSKAELLALILRTGTVSRPITTICNELLDACGDSLYNLMRKSTQELLKVDGIGEVKAQQILAIMELTKRFAHETENPRLNIIRSSQDIYNNLKYDIGNLPHEEIWLLTLSQRHNVIGRHILSKGTYTASIFDVKMAVKHAILDEASAIILAHNHPSGTTMPSPQDDNITRQLRKAADILSLRLLDHVIVTTEGFYSYADQGRL